MIHVIAILITLLVIAIKAYWDNKNWSNVDHTKGIVLVALVLVPTSIFAGSLYPIFLFGLLWNLVINKVRGLSFFYVGNTAITDIILRFIFGDRAGESFFFINLILLIYSLL